MDAVDEIKQRLAIEDVIGEYVELKRAGRNFKALSPFGNEKTASFMISPEKQIFYDRKLFQSGISQPTKTQDVFLYQYIRTRCGVDHLSSDRFDVF